MIIDDVDSFAGHDSSVNSKQDRTQDLSESLFGESISEVKEVLLRNTSNLFGLLPGKSEHRGPLISVLLRDIDPAAASRMFGLNLHTVRNSLMIRDVEKRGLFSDHEKRCVSREKTSLDECMTTMDFLRGHMTQKSGSARESYYYASNKELCEQHRSEWHNITASFVKKKQTFVEER